MCDTFICITRLVHTCDMTDMTDVFLWHDSFTQTGVWLVKRKDLIGLIHFCTWHVPVVRDISPLLVWNDSFTHTGMSLGEQRCVASYQSPICICDAFICLIGLIRRYNVTRLIHTHRHVSSWAQGFDARHQYSIHICDALMCLIWLIHMCNVTRLFHAEMSLGECTDLVRAIKPSFICVIHLCVWYDLFVCLTCHDSFTHTGMSLGERKDLMRAIKPLIGTPSAPPPLPFGGVAAGGGEGGEGRGNFLKYVRSPH